MSNGFVKMTNRKFTTIKNDHCITFDIGANIFKCDEPNSHIPHGPIFDFTCLDDLKKGGPNQYTMIDVIGIITDVQEISQIQIKATQEWRDKRTITIAEDSGLSVQVTLWGEAAHKDDIKTGTVLAMKSVRVSAFGGLSLNVSLEQS